MTDEDEIEGVPFDDKVAQRATAIAELARTVDAVKDKEAKALLRETIAAVKSRIAPKADLKSIQGGKPKPDPKPL